MTGLPHEHLEFTSWYLVQKKLVARDDQSNLIITADGVDFLEQHLVAPFRKRLPE